MDRTTARYRTPFSISINARQSRSFTINGNDYVALRSGSEYSITLRNMHNTRCDADVYIDDENVGLWVIDANDSITIERPAGKQRKFTFFSEHSHVAKDTGAIRGHEANGIIHVIFKPKLAELSYIPLSSQGAIQTRGRSQSPTRNMARSRSPERLNATPTLSKRLPITYDTAAYNTERYDSGVTVLGDRSYQRFGSIPRLRENEIDHSMIRNVYVRLVVENEPKYEPIKNTRYPPRLDGFHDSRGRDRDERYYLD